MSTHPTSRPWGRRRLLLGAAAVLAAAAVLIAGLILAVHTTITTHQPPPPHTAKSAATDGSGVPMSSEAARDATRNAIAAEPMLPVTPEDAQTTTPAATTPPVMPVPIPTAAGPAGVPAGFPHTTVGAVAQLAAIDTTVLQAMSVPATNDIHRQWALPGGVGVGEWELTRNVQAFLGAARMGPVLDATATVSVAPAAAQVKGLDGPDWVLACVLLDVRASINGEARMGYAHCERMQWHGNRWMIAPGRPPARAPSTWPGSQRSIDAGWRTWVFEGGR